MAAEEETRPVGLDAGDHLPVLDVDDRKFGAAQVRRRHHPSAVANPGDAGPQVGHAAQGQLGDFPSDVQVDHHPGVIGARRAHQVAVVRGEEKVVERTGRGDAPQGEEPLRGRDRLDPALFIVVDKSLIDRIAFRAGGDFPNLRHVLQRGDEAFATGGLIDCRNPRGCARLVGHVENFLDGKIVGRKDHQAGRQVVGNGQMLAVAGNGDVAGIDAGAHLGHRLQAPDVIFHHPSVARHDEDIAAVGGELRSAMHRIARREAGNRLHDVAIQHGDVVIAGFHHQGDVQGIAGKDRRLGRSIVAVKATAGGDFRLPPNRDHRRWLAQERGEFADLRRAQARGVPRHLGERSARGDHLSEFFTAQPRQRLGKQGRAGVAQARVAVTACAVVLVQLGGRRTWAFRCRLGGLGRGGAAVAAAVGPSEGRKQQRAAQQNADQQAKPRGGAASVKNSGAWLHGPVL